MVESFRITFEQELQGASADIFNVRWSADSSQIAVGTSNGYIQLYNSSYELQRTMNCQSGAEKMPVTSIRFRPEIQEFSRKPVILSTTCDGGVNHWNIGNGKCLNVTRLRNEQIYAADFNMDGSAYALGCKEGKIKIFDENTLQENTVLSHVIQGEDTGAQRVFCIKWFDHQLILSGGWDNKMTIWDIRSQHPVREMFGPHICGDSIDIRDNYIVSGSYHIRDQVQVWALDSGRNIHTVTLEQQGRKCMPYALEFCNSEGFVFAVGGTGSGEVSFYNAVNMQLVGTLNNINKTVYSMHRSSNNKLAVSVGSSCNVYLTK